jgi:alpha-D-ribose 1-methylphosphonate 5-phosphate C-P lyase
MASSSLENPRTTGHDTPEALLEPEEVRVPTQKKSKVKRYHALRPHAARIAKVAEYPVHVNGAYMDDPERIPLFEPAKRPKA